MLSDRNENEKSLFMHYQIGNTDGPWTTDLRDFEDIETEIVTGSKGETFSGVPVALISELSKAITTMNKSGRARHLDKVASSTRAHKLEPYGGPKRVADNAIENKSKAEELLNQACAICAYNALCKYSFNIDKYAGENNKKNNLYFLTARKSLAVKQSKDPTIRCDYKEL